MTVNDWEARSSSFTFSVHLGNVKVGTALDDHMRTFLQAHANLETHVLDTLLVSCNDLVYTVLVSCNHLVIYRK